MCTAVPRLPHYILTLRGQSSRSRMWKSWKCRKGFLTVTLRHIIWFASAKDSKYFSCRAGMSAVPHAADCLVDICYRHLLCGIVICLVISIWPRIYWHDSSTIASLCWRSCLTNKVSYKLVQSKTCWLLLWQGHDSSTIASLCWRSCLTNKVSYKLVQSKTCWLLLWQGCQSVLKVLSY